MSSDKKFLFDLNNFDDNDEISEEDLVPTFSEDELVAAKEQAFAEGKQAGITEEKAQREQHIASTLSQIMQATQTLLASENMREQTYEQESLHLFQTALGKMFPDMNRRSGFEEVHSMVEKIVLSQRKDIKICIKVMPDYVPDIEQKLNEKMAHIEPKPYEIIGDDALNEGDCIMEWADGGAIRDAGGMISAMLNEVDRLLPEEAGHSRTGENRDIKNNKNEESGDLG